MWYTKNNLRIAQSGANVIEIVGPNIEASKSVAHQMLRKDYVTLKKAIDAQNYLEIPLENKLWIQIDTLDPESIFEGTLSEIIKKVSANDQYKSKVKDPNATQAFNPAALASYQSQQAANDKKTINPLLVSPYGNKKMPGYAQLGEEKPIKKISDEEPLTEREMNYIKEKADEIKNLTYKYNIPGTAIYLGHTSQDFDNWLKSNPLTELATTLIDPMVKSVGYSLSQDIILTTEGTEFILPTLRFNEPNLQMTASNEVNRFYEKLKTLLNKYQSNIENIRVQIVDARAQRISMNDSMLPLYKKTSIPIRVESAMYTYSDRLPVDIYLNDKLFKKGYPNNTYFIFYPEVHKLPRGSNKLLIVDPRPGNQNITQSKTQLIEFRVEPNEELIVYNVVPNRIIR